MMLLTAEDKWEVTGRRRYFLLPDCPWILGVR